MSYIALYRKHRPQKFFEVINQDHIKKTLINALAHDKVAHAYLFSGPRGVGKTTIGRLLAKAVNCSNLNNNNGEACNKCDNCKEISSEKTVDITEIDAASNRGIDEMRELREKIKYMPSKLKYRVFIIDEVHMLTIEAFNALLKTLEEPPAHIIFILATTEPQKIPPTILSRCQRFDFKKIGVQEIINHLEKISKKEQIKIDKEGLKMIAQNADGSSRDALSLLGQVQSAFNKKNIAVQDIVDLLGLASDQMIFDIAEQILEKNIKRSLEMTNELIMRGYDPSLLLDSIIEFLRKLLLLKNTEDYNLFLATSEEQEKINELIEKIDNKELLSLINYLIEGKNILKYSPLSQLPLEMAIIKYINPDESDIKATNNNLNKPKPEPNKDNPDKSIKKEVQAINIRNENLNSEISNDTNLKEVDYATIDSKWAEIVENITSDNYSLGLTLRSSKPIKVSGNKLILECNYSFHKDCIQNSKNRDIVEKMISAKTGMPVSLKCVVSENKPTPENQANDIKKEESNKDNSSNLINTALDIMGGEVVK